MNGGSVLVVYLLVGVACAVAIVARSAESAGRTAASAVGAIVLWPLWAPFALAPPRRASASASVSSRGIARALDEAVLAVVGTPLEPLFPRQTADRIGAEVARVEARAREIVAVAGPNGIDVGASARALAGLEAAGASPRTIASARLRHESVARLAAIHSSTLAALADLEALLDTLRARLLLARFEGAAADGVESIVAEVWTRLEGLAAASEDETRGPSSQDAP